MPNAISGFWIWSLARRAVALLRQYPFRWLALVLLFLIVAESLMFIPYVGFISKLTIAGLLSAQVLVLFRDADAGSPPRIRRLSQVFMLPAISQVVIVGATLIPFLIGILYLAIDAGTLAVTFFFGNILSDAPPEPDSFFRFKLVMYVASLPFAFVPAAVTLARIPGWRALAACRTELVG